MGGSSRVVAPRTAACGRAVAVFVLGLQVLAASGCVAPSNSLDFANDSELYPGTGYEVRTPCDRQAFVMTVVDSRGRTPREAASGPVSYHWIEESYWDRSVPVMLAEVLERELVDSGLVASLDDTPPPAADAVLIRLELTQGRAGVETRVEGSRHVAEVGVQLQVFGPIVEGSERPMWIDQPFQRSKGTGMSLKPPPIPGVYASVFGDLLADVLAYLDQSNVTRSGVPLMLDEGGAGTEGAGDTGR